MKAVNEKKNYPKPYINNTLIQKPTKKFFLKTVFGSCHLGKNVYWVTKERFVPCWLQMEKQ